MNRAYALSERAIWIAFPRYDAQPPRRRWRGLGLPEMLISLALTAALLTAAAIALDLSFKGYQINQERSMLTQRGRLALERIVQQIRTTDLHQPHTAEAQAKFKTLSRGQSIDDTGIDLGIRKGDGSYSFASYYYVPGSDGVGQLVYDDLDPATPPRVMVDGVTAFKISFEPGKSRRAARAGTPNDILVRASITLSLRTTEETAHHSESTGSQVVTMSTSVIPRQNVW